MTSVPAPPRSSTPESQLVDHLADRLRRGDRRTIATLRRQGRRLGDDSVDPQAAAIVYPHVGRSAAAQDAGMLTACLWAAWHTGYDRPVNADGTDLGAAVRRLPADRAERLFTELATATGPTLPDRICHAIDALAAAGIALDWRRLHRDLRAWLYGDTGRVLRRWSTSLYATTEPATEE